MRIISGSHKGRRLSAPKNLPVRPTTDRSKEALFNILQNQYQWDDVAVLDLFSGTGSISYEFASRGVKNVIAVDQNKMCVNYIRKTSEQLEFPIQVIQIEAVKYIKAVNQQFELVFADPPYGMEKDLYTEMITGIFDKKVLTEKGLMIVEHSDQMSLEGNFFFYESRRYGSNVFSFFKY